MKDIVIVSVMMIYIIFLICLSICCLIYGRYALSKRIYDNTLNDLKESENEISKKNKLSFIFCVISDVLICIFILTGILLAIAGYLSLVLPIFTGCMISCIAKAINYETYVYYKSKIKLKYNK